MMQGAKLLIILMFVVPVVLAGCVPSVGNGGRQGTSQEYLKGEVVGGFPSLPLYEKAQVLESYGFEGKYGASFISSDKLADVVNFYNDSLAVLGWDVRLSQESETNYVFEIKNAQSDGRIIVNTASDGKKTAITMSVEPR